MFRKISLILVLFAAAVLCAAPKSKKPAPQQTPEKVLQPVRFIRKGKNAAEKNSARKNDPAAGKTVTISVFPEKTGEVLKNILGMNNSPRISSASAMKKEKELFKKLAPARVRHHDAALVDPGYALIDVSRIFPLFHADHNDPANYNFAPTDFCLEQIAGCGTDIEFRFGESIEHSGRHFRVNPPRDPEKFAAICINILRHYNEKWANGKALNIKYVSLWEEPDNSKLFDAPFEKYLALYKVFSRQMKKAFPNLKIGGAQAVALGKTEEFIAYCRKNSLPLDFVSTTWYGRTPEALANRVKRTRMLTEKYGFHDAEIFLAEWHLGPRSWKNMRAEKNMPVSTENAAFSVAALMAAQDIADMLYFYCWSGRGWIWSLFSADGDPGKVYYALAYYTELTNKNLKKAAVNISSSRAGIYHLCGIDNDGNIYLLISKFRSRAEDLTIVLPASYKKCEVKIISDSTPAEGRVKTIKSIRQGTFSLHLESGLFGVYLMKFEK